MFCDHTCDDTEGSTAEQLPLYSQATASDTGYSLGRTLQATTVRILSVSPLEAFNHAKSVVETKLVNLHLLASDVAQAAVEVSQSATKQARIFILAVLKIRAKGGMFCH